MRWDVAIAFFTALKFYNNSFNKIIGKTLLYKNCQNQTWYSVAHKNSDIERALMEAWRGECLW